MRLVHVLARGDHSSHAKCGIALDIYKDWGVGMAFYANRQLQYNEAWCKLCEDAIDPLELLASTEL